MLEEGQDMAAPETTSQNTASQDNASRDRKPPTFSHLPFRVVEADETATQLGLVTLETDLTIETELRHFIGDGGTTAGRDQGNTALPTNELLEQHGSGYTGALEAGVDTVMATFNSVNGQKVHGSKALLTDVLRTQLGFEGMVISDWNGIGQVSGCSDTRCAQAINAGIDMVMVPTQWRAFRDNLLAQVRGGQV
ncbi:MAG: hypothetical protein EBZ11_06975, partial [Alphaproteobacteria bacterium]|nr:hypothetical protein [Alphaproteobacteria bacterium]